MYFLSPILLDRLGLNYNWNREARVSVYSSKSYNAINKKTHKSNEIFSQQKSKLIVLVAFDFAHNLRLKSISDFY